MFVSWGDRQRNSVGDLREKNNCLNLNHTEKPVEYYSQ